MPDWDEDSDALIDNLRKAYCQSRDSALDRNAPGVDLARGWHATVMAGLAVPDEGFVGRFRGESGLEGCEVRVGAYAAVPSSSAERELQGFERTLARAVSALDRLIPPGAAPGSGDRLNAVIELCAWAHAEWVRIHPFANSNGRTARIWTGFIAMRYGLPPFVRLRPRPDGGYGTACGDAMEGNWAPTAEAFRRMYLEVVGEASDP